MRRSAPTERAADGPPTVQDRLDALEDELEAERDARRQLEAENEQLRQRLEDLEDLVEVRAESIEEANATDVWIAGVPIGTIVDGANERAKDASKAVDELQDDLGGDVVNLEQRVTAVEATVDTDLSEKSYQELTRKDKVLRIQSELIEDAKERPTGKAAMNYKEGYYLFDAQPSKGHVYDLMDLAAQDAGFSYDKRDDEVNRLTVDLGDVNESLLVHAANTPTEGGTV